MALSCLPGASPTVQLILSCLPGASQAVQMVLSCLPGASLVPRSPFHIKLSLARAKSVAAFKTMILSYCIPNPLLPGRKEPFGSLRGTREAPGRQERAIWTAWEAPVRHQGDL